MPSEPTQDGTYRAVTVEANSSGAASAPAHASDPLPEQPRSDRRLPYAAALALLLLLLAGWMITHRSPAERLRAHVARVETTASQSPTEIRQALERLELLEQGVKDADLSPERREELDRLVARSRRAWTAALADRLIAEGALDEAKTVLGELDTLLALLRDGRSLAPQDQQVLAERKRLDLAMELGRLRATVSQRRPAEVAADARGVAAEARSKDYADLARDAWLLNARALVLAADDVLSRERPAPALQFLAQADAAVEQAGDQVPPGLAADITERRERARVLLLGNALERASAAVERNDLEGSAEPMRVLLAALEEGTIPAGASDTMPERIRELARKREDVVVGSLKQTLEEAQQALVLEDIESCRERLQEVEAALEDAVLREEARRSVRDGLDMVQQSLEVYATATINGLLRHARQALREGDLEGSSDARARQELADMDFLSEEAAARLEQRIDEYVAQRTVLARQTLVDRVETLSDSFAAGRFKDWNERLDGVRQTLDDYTFLADADREAVEALLEPHLERASMYAEVQQAAKDASSDYQAAKTRLRELLDVIPRTDDERRPLRRHIAAQLKSVERAQEAAFKAWLAQEGPDDPAMGPVLGHLLDEADEDIRYVPGNKDRAQQPEINVTYQDQSFVLRPERGSDGRTMVIEAAGLKFEMPARLFYLWPAQYLSRATQAVEDLQQTDLDEAQIQQIRWNLQALTPVGGVSGRLDGENLLVVDGRALTMRGVNRRSEFRMRMAGFQSAADRLRRAVQNAEGIPEQARAALTYIVRVTYRGAKPHDFLEPSYVRRLLSEGYIERLLGEQMPEALIGPIDDYRKAFDKLSGWMDVRNATDDDEDQPLELSLLINLNGQQAWRVRAGDGITSFITQLPMENAYSALRLSTDFEGKVDKWEEGMEPVRVRMLHPIFGELARYELKDGEFTFEQDNWDRAIRMDEYISMDDHFGGAWRVAPHVVLMDHLWRTRAVVLETGRLDFPSWPEDAEERRQAQDAFVTEVAKVMPDSGALALFFRYFVQYTLDSPVPNMPDLLGSSAHSGDIHQDVYQFLDRIVGGRIACDCDDLAEFYTVVTRQPVQDKISYVCGVPAHATCGWVEVDEQAPEEKRYAMYFLDTGPPRRFFSSDLHDVIEQGYRSYDHDNRLEFNPDSVQFLFRFAGEPTRTPYVLGARMFVDEEYGELLRRVQGMWHFHTYLQGIKVMLEEATRDPIPPNCNEIAGLYRATRQWKKAIEWRRRGMENGKEKDVISRLQSLADIATLHVADDDKDSAREVLAEVSTELRRLEEMDEDSERYQAMRFSVAARLTHVNRPLQAWELLRGDAMQMAEEHRLAQHNAGVIVGIYRGVRKRAGDDPSPKQARALREMKGLLDRYFAQDLFEDDDDIGEVFGKYSTLSAYLSVIHGQEKLREALLADGPWPNPNSRRHTQRGRVEFEEDWMWIRLSFPAYAAAIGKVLPGGQPRDLLSEEAEVDEDEQQDKKGDPEMALRLIDAAERALGHIKDHGSVNRYRWGMMGFRIVRSCLKKDIEEFEAVLKEAREQDWGPIYRMVGSTVGSSARLVDREFFAEQMELYRQYIPTKPQFFQVAYQAYRVEAFEQAKLAARIAAEQYPDDPVMQEERDFLIKLCDQKARELEEKKARKKAEAQDVDDEQEEETDAAPQEDAAPVGAE